MSIIKMFRKLTWTDGALCLTPIVTGFLASGICPVKDRDEDRQSFRPPGIVFSVIWPILYILLGISWAIANRQNKLNNISYGILNTLLVAWIIVYGCVGSKQAALYILLLSIVMAIVSGMVGTLRSRILVAPLIAWLIFAMMLSLNDRKLR